MIIGLDAREAAGHPAGKGRYVQEMLRYLPEAGQADRFVAYVHDIPDLKLPANAAWQPLGASGLSWHREAARRAARECDVYFATTSYLTPQFLRLPFVMTVYDLITFKDFAIPQRRARAIERLTLKRAVKRASGVLTISQATADDLIALVPEAAGNVTVTPLAADERFAKKPSASRIKALKQKYQLPDSFILTTGTIEPRKNLARLLTAYTGLPETLRRKYGLVLAGKRGWQADEIWETLEASRRTDDVHYLDFVSDEELADLYGAATVFCYPSLYEGFGLPVLEAMTAGLPVITSATSSLPEVGGEAVRYVDPYDTESIGAGLTDLLGSAAKRGRLARAGRKRAQEFSWQRTAAQTLEALHAA